MAGLPPKPVDSPLRDIDDRHYAPDDRDRLPARPMASRYMPRSQPGRDTYIASGYNRRDDDSRRLDYDDRDRDRRGWEPSRDRDSRFRDRGRPPRSWEREPDFDRDRRGYDRDRRFDRRRDDPPYSRFRDSDRRDSRLSPRRSDSYRRSSRTPPPRRRISISPSRRGREYSRTRSPPRSPQPKRLKLGNHSIGASPRSRSRSKERARECPQDDTKNVAKPKSPSRSPMQMPGGDADTQPKRVLSITQPKPESTLTDASVLSEPPGSSDAKPSGAPVDEKHSPKLAQAHATEPQTAESSTMPIDLPNAEQVLVKVPSPNPVPVPTPNASITISDPQHSVAPGSSGDVQMRDVSHSPPRHPRYRGGAPRGAPFRRSSRSPPRGPRNQNQFRNPQAPPSSHPTGPRGRRAFPPTPTAPSAALSAPTVPAETPLTPDQEPGPTNEAEPEPEAKAPLPTIPQWQRPQPTGPQGEIARLRALQARLASEYPPLDKGARRALYELELSTIDLRAAEARRKVADAQMEKARFGLLGIDAVQSDIPVV
ncbi:hypothetical protein BD779DRAFT_1668968 [Infundibulicybe gibba]|nr:hypothetical protein BD779DRAFT_1668968 [Infundibulicybe gibba]